MVVSLKKLFKPATVSSHLKKKQRGEGMQSTIFGLGIGAVIISGLAGVFYFARGDAATEAVSRDINLIIKNASSAYRNGFTGVSTCAPLVDNKVFGGTTFKVSGSGSSASVAHSSGGAVTCAVDSGNARILDITLQGLENSQCVQMVNKAQDGTQGIVVGTTTVKALNGALDNNAVGTACNASASANNQSVTFRLLGA